MKYLIEYRIFESSDGLNDVAIRFVDYISKYYDLRFGSSFDREKANCSWFTKVFYDWAKSESLSVSIVYFDSDVEAHIAPMLHGKVVDFSVKQFTKNPNDDFQFLDIEDYRKWGYEAHEILDEFPDWVTIREADKIIF